MANINLTSLSQEERKQGRFSQGALVGVFAILILVLIVWGGLLLYKQYYLEKNISDAKTSYKTYMEQLAKSDSQKVIDFQRRLDVSKDLIAQTRSMPGDLAQVEASMIPNSFIASYSYDDANKRISLNCVGDNFNTMAKQILSFKNSAYFSSVTAGASVVDAQTGKITFPIELTIR